MNEHDAPLLFDDFLEDHIELSNGQAALSSTFFPGANRGYLADLIRFLLEYDPQLLVVTGARGVGKTVLLTAITDRAPPTWRVCSASACTLGTPHAVFVELLRQLELPAPGAATLNVPMVTERLYKLQRSGSLPVLLLDDVQVLRSEVIEAILSLAVTPENQTQPPLRIALFGVPSLVEQVAALNQEVRVRCLQVLPFNEEQAREYIAFRRNDTVDNVERVLSGAQLAELMAETEGLPGKINQWMDKGGALKLAEEPRAPGRRLIWTVGALLALAGSFVFQERIHEWVSPLWSGQARPPSAAGVMELPVQTAPPLAQVQIGAAASPGDALPAELSTPEPTPEVVVLEGAPPALDAATDAAPTSAEVMVEPSPAPVEPSPAPVEQTSANSLAASDVAASSSAAAEVVVAATPSAPPTPVPEPTATADPAEDGIRREAWILAQHQEAHTLRIMSVRNEAALKEYIKDNNLLEQVAYYKAWRSTGAWYVLIYGVYPSEAKALEAKSEVDARLGIKKPLPGQFSELQADIRKTLGQSR